MDFTPQVETAEIADADLDNVSGGLLDGLVGNVLGTVDGTLGEVTGVVDGLTGINLSEVTGGVGL